jgi:hypothetical protein
MRRHSTSLIQKCTKHDGYHLTPIRIISIKKKKKKKKGGGNGELRRRKEQVLVKM